MNMEQIRKIGIGLILGSFIMLVSFTAFADITVTTTEDELNRRLDESCISQYHQGMRVIDVISDMFSHMNHHNGHLSAINGDWCRQQKEAH